jgi:hypothetical protein
VKPVEMHLPVFHAGGGLFIQRLSNGDVRIMTTTKGESPLASGVNLVTDFTIDRGSWMSIVASTSARGDCLETIMEVEALMNKLPPVPLTKGLNLGSDY